MIYRKALTYALFICALPGGIWGCSEIPTSVCGVGLSAEECERVRAAFTNFVAGSCEDGQLTGAATRQLKGGVLVYMRGACQEANNQHSLDRIFYTLLTDIKCGQIESGSFDIPPLFSQTLGWATGVDELAYDETRALRDLCNDFRQARISGRDWLHQEAQLHRDFERNWLSTIWSDITGYLTWNAKFLVGLVGLIGTVIGILVGLKALFSSRQ